MSTRQESRPQRLVNLGCGRHYHADWINVDLVSHDPAVLQRDLRGDLPFADRSIDMVYHSHVLEHFTRDEARRFLRECFRILAPEGVLRIAVPDLEQIARMYLEALQQAVAGEAGADFRYRWMKLELIDQMIRTHSGGEMGQVMTTCPADQHRFLETRMGGEYRTLTEGTSESPAADSTTPKSRIPLQQKFVRELGRLRDRLVRGLLKRCYGKIALRRWDEATFRSQGEIHQWMYDRYSLQCLLEEIGFVQVVVQQADTSLVDGFADYRLDAVGDRPRKPDSLFMEARRPAAARSAGRQAA